MDPPSVGVPGEQSQHVGQRRRRLVFRRLTPLLARLGPVWGEPQTDPIRLVRSCQPGRPKAYTLLFGVPKPKLLYPEPQ